MKKFILILLAMSIMATYSCGDDDDDAELIGMLPSHEKDPESAVVYTKNKIKELANSTGIVDPNNDYLLGAFYTESINNEKPDVLFDSTVVDKYTFKETKGQVYSVEFSYKRDDNKSSVKDIDIDLWIFSSSYKEVVKYSSVYVVNFKWMISNIEVSELKDANNFLEDSKSITENVFDLDFFVNKKIMANVDVEMIIYIEESMDEEESIKTDVNSFADVKNVKLATGFEYGKFSDFLEFRKIRYKISSSSPVPISIDKFYSFQKKSSRPKNFTYQKIDNYSVNLTWDRIDLISKYDIFTTDNPTMFSKDNDNTYIDKIEIEQENSYTFRNTNNFNRLYFYIYPCFSSGMYGKSSQLEVNF